MYKRKQLPVSRIFVDLVFHCVTRMLLTKNEKYEHQHDILNTYEIHIHDITEIMAFQTNKHECHNLLFVQALRY